MASWFRAGTLLLLVGLAGCASAPLVEFRTYASASEEVSRTTLKLLDDYQAAMTEPETEVSEVPVTFDWRATGKASAPGVEARRAAVAAIREYNAAMLFLAEGGSYEAVRGRVDSLAALIGAAIPPIGVAAGMLGTLGGELEKARSAGEFRAALQKAVVPSASGQPCGAATPASPPPADKKALIEPSAAAPCEPVIEGIYRIMKVDATSFYAAQLGRYERARSELRDLLDSEVVAPLRAYAARFHRPANEAALRRLVAIEAEILRVGRELNPRYPDRPFAAGGANLDDEALAIMEMRLQPLKALSDRNRALKVAAIAYHQELGAYIQLIEQAQAYLRLVEEAAIRPADNVARAEEVVRLGIKLESKAIRSREAFQSASRILLGGGAQ